MKLRDIINLKRGNTHPSYVGRDIVNEYMINMPTIHNELSSNSVRNILIPIIGNGVVNGTLNVSNHISATERGVFDILNKESAKCYHNYAGIVIFESISDQKYRLWVYVVVLNNASIYTTTVNKSEYVLEELTTDTNHTIIKDYGIMWLHKQDYESLQNLTDLYTL